MRRFAARGCLLFVSSEVFFHVHSSNQLPAAVPGVTKEQIVIVAVVVFGAFLALLNQTVMAPVFPIIMIDFRIAAIVVTLINALALITNTTLPILLQTALGASAMNTGLVMLPAALAGLIVSSLSGVAFDRFGPRAMSIAGMAMMMVSMLALSQVGTGASLAIVVALCAV